MKNSMLLEIFLKFLFYQFICPHKFDVSPKTKKVEIKSYKIHKVGSFVKTWKRES